MNKENWGRAKELFDQAQGLAPEEREALLANQCGDDPELRDQVQRLLGSYDSEFLESSVLDDAAPFADDDRFLPGKMIGRYRVGELIGTGGMGRVFIADDTELNRPVAVKVLHSDVAENDERVRRFIREAQAASALNHPNILTIYEIGSFEGARFIVSEYVDGETLRDKMRNGLTPAESLDIMCQVAAALQAAHAAGIVHRDIKPENIMLRQDGLVKVLDFGLAKLTEADDLPIDSAASPHSRLQTSPGLIMGTVAYMSPEQASGKAVDSRTDLWSLGVVFHEMLTGESPFKGESVTDLVTSIIKYGATSLDLTAISKEFQPICSKALAKDKKARYQTAQDLLQDLQGEKKRMEYAIQGTPFITVSSTDELKTQLIRRRPTLSAEYIVTSVKRHKYATLFMVALIAASGIGLFVYKYDGATPPRSRQAISAIDASTNESDLKTYRLPISGETRQIVISPDGKYLAYSPGKGVRVMERASSAETEIFSQGPIWGLVFSPDSQFVYYSFSPNAPKGPYAVMKLSIAGGTPTKFIDGADNGVGFSPDGSKIVFTREDNDGQLIIVANGDGSKERTISHTDWDHMIEGPSIFSPDGKTIAGEMRIDSKNGSFNHIVGYSVADGSMQLLSEKKWDNTWGMVWLPNGTLVVAAKEGVSDASQLWAILAGAEPRAITSGLVSYRDLSATSNGDILVANQVTEGDDRDLWVLQGNDARTARRVTTSGELRGRFALTPDGLIVMGSTVSGNPDIWLMNASGGGRKQLTNDPGIDAQPAVSPDGKFIAFTSDRVKGIKHIFLMDIQGGNLRQLTNGDQEVLASFSPDGKWVYFVDDQYRRGGKYVRKVSINGGESTLVATPPDGWSVMGIDVNKADGRLVYGLEQMLDGWHYKVGILTPNGKPKLIDLSGHLVSMRPRWAPDNRSIVIMSTVADGPDSLDAWSISADGKGKPRQVTDFRTPGSADPKWSADGKLLFFSRGISISNPVLIRNTGN